MEPTPAKSSSESRSRGIGRFLLLARMLLAVCPNRDSSDVRMALGKVKNQKHEAYIMRNKNALTHAQCLTAASKQAFCSTEVHIGENENWKRRCLRALPMSSAGLIGVTPTGDVMETFQGAHYGCTSHQCCAATYAAASQFCSPTSNWPFDFSVRRLLRTCRHRSRCEVKYSAFDMGASR